MGGDLMGEKTQYIRVRQEQFAEEFIENCIEKARTLYGLTEEQMKKLLQDMGYCKSP